MNKKFPAFAASAALVLIGAPLVTSSPAQAADLGPCTNAPTLAIDNKADLQRYELRDVLGKMGFESQTSVGGRAGDIRTQSLVSDDLVVALHKSDGGFTTYRLGDKSMSNITSGGSGWGNITRLVPQGDGVFYAIHNDGKMTFHKVSADGKEISGGNEIGSGWGNYKNVAGTGKGHVYAINASNEIVHYHRVDWDKPNGTGFVGGAQVKKGSLPEIHEMQGVGTGVLVGFFKDGKTGRITVQGDKFNVSMAGGQGWNSMANITVAPGHCGKAPAGSLRTNVLDWSRRIMAGERIPATAHSVAWTNGTRPIYSWGGGHANLAGPSYGIDHGASRLGVDCSGFARWVYALASGGRDVLGSFVTQDMKKMDQLERISADQVQPGDLAWHAEHVMVVKSIGGGRFVSYEAQGTAEGLHDDVSRSVDTHVFYRVKG